MIQECKFCGQPILWARTTDFEPIAINRDPDRDGMVIILDSPCGPIASKMTQRQELPKYMRIWSEHRCRRYQSPMTPKTEPKPNDAPPKLEIVKR